MVDKFDAEILNKIKDMQGDTCISIYLPTHQEGLEVNENMDIISFKNEIQDVQIQLGENGYDNRSIEKLLKPAWDLVHDTSFWKVQSHGLAVFINENYFQYFRLPVSFRVFSLISTRFIFTPLIQALEMNNKFFILSLNQYEFKLLECTTTSVKEVEFDEVSKTRLIEALAPFDYKNDLYESNDPYVDPVNGNMKKQVLERAKKNGDVNLAEFFRVVNYVVSTHVKESKAPLVLAGLDEWQALYRKINSYNNLYEQGYVRNAQFLPDKELHKVILPIINPYFKRRQENYLSRYHASAGTGMTSNALKNILVDANAGRVDTIFILKDKYLWGKYNNAENTITKDQDPTMDNYCLLNYAASITLRNGGHVFLLDGAQMPEEAPIAAIYRY